jgi:hypothetical protein
LVSTSCDERTALVKKTRPACIKFLPYHMDNYPVALSIWWLEVHHVQPCCQEWEPMVFDWEVCSGHRQPG